MEENDKIKEANNLKEEFTSDADTEEYLYKYEIWKMDQKEFIKEAREEGLKEGEKEGIKKGIKKNQIQVIKAMLKENADINFICKVIGLSEDEIKNIEKN